MNNNIKTIKIIEELNNTSIFDKDKIAQLLEALNVSSKIDAQEYIDNHELNHYLVEHTFISEDDENVRLVIRPLRIVLNFYKNFKVVGRELFFNECKDDINILLLSIGVTLDELETEFEAITSLFNDVNAINAINILDDKIN